MQHWYEMEGFSADPNILAIYERESQKVFDLAEAHPKDPTIQAVTSAFVASRAQSEMIAQYMQTILKAQSREQP